MKNNRKRAVRASDSSQSSARRALSRRDFISSAAALAASLSLPSRAQNPGKIPVGSNIYGWGQYYQRMGKNVNDHLDEVMESLRRSDYDFLEGFVDVARPDNNAGFADRLRRHGLRPVSIYSGARLHEPDAARQAIKKLLAAASVCRRAGYSVIDCNPEPIGRPKTDPELDAQAKALDELGRGLSELGLRLAIHNHTPEMANHAREFHHDLDATNPQWVGFCYDVHWVFRGGIPPEQALPKYGARVASWHLRQSRNGIWWETLDDGDVDYHYVARYAKEHHMSAPYTVELALEHGTRVTGSVFENHRLSREYVRRVFGV